MINNSNDLIESFQYDKIKNIFFTFNQGIGLILAIRIYIYGLKRNNFYSFSERKIFASISGCDLESIDYIKNFIFNLFNKKDVNIFTSSINRNPDYSLKKISNINTKDIPKNKIAYKINYISKNIDDLQKELSLNQKDFFIFINRQNIDLDRIVNSFDINLVINKNTDLNIKNEKNIQNIFDHKLLFFNIISSKYNNKYSLVTYFPLGFLHKSFLVYSLLSLL